VLFILDADPDDVPEDHVVDGVVAVDHSRIERRPLAVLQFYPLDERIRQGVICILF